MKKITLIIITVFCIISLNIFSQTKKDSLNKTDKIKTGWNFGVLPAISYNTDRGFQYGGILNLYNYGDGKIYPKYYHSICTEISRTTKGGGVNQIFYDSEHLLKNVRVTSVLSFLTEKSLDFYGFNGYQVKYNSDWEDDSKAEDIYKSRVFYRHERKMFRFLTDFQGNLYGKKLRWIAGIGIYNFDIGTVDIDKLNKGKNDDEKLPDIDLLYDKYVDWGIISDKEKDGGSIYSAKLGLIYDTRDNEPNPMKGMWTEALINTAPSFLGNKDFAYTKLSIIHRQYFTLIKEKLSFVYRLGYQGTIAGEAPFFIQTYMISSFNKYTTTDGLGGARTLRGILRNRVVGDAIAYGNFEFRWKFYKTYIWRQNIYLAFNAFADAGKVVKDIDFDKTEVKTIMDSEPDYNYDDYFDTSSDDIHLSYGAGFRIAMNQNFIVSIDYGKTNDTRDGTSGIYIALGYLF